MGFDYRRSRTRSALDTPQTPDLNVLNFALNLEYLEAEYYLRAVTGQGISAFLDIGTPGTVTVPANTLVPFQVPAVAYWAQRIANDELAHVNFLREAIVAEGGTPIAEPNIDFVTGFTVIALLAGLIAEGEFNPFASEVDFLVGAYILEDLGVSAYAGAAQFFTLPANVAYAASILAVEAEHAGCIRAYLAQRGGGGITDLVSKLRSTLSFGQPGFDNGTDVLNGKRVVSSYVFANADYNGQVYRRLPSQVLNVLYAKSGTGNLDGGFFPNGVNGLIVST